MKEIWDKRDIMNALCVVTNSLNGFEPAEKEIIKLAVSNAETVLFYVNGLTITCPPSTHGFFKKGLEKNNSQLDLLFSYEPDKNKKFILGFLLRAVRETLKIMRNGKL